MVMKMLLLRLLLVMVIAFVCSMMTEGARKPKPIWLNPDHLIKGKEICREPANRELQLQIKNTTDILVDCWRIRLAKKSLQKVIDQCAKENSLCDCGNTFGLTSMLFLTKQEAKNSLSGFRRHKKKSNRKLAEAHHGIKFRTRRLTEFPKEFNFETSSPLGFSPIQNQGRCPTCWAFALVAALEGNIRTNSKKLIKVSEQAAVSCFHGCKEMNPVDSYDKYVQAGRLPYNRLYPYVSFGPERVPKCNKWLDKPSEQAVRVIDSQVGYFDDDESIQEALLEIGPVIVAVDSSSDCFRSYTSSVLTQAKCPCNGKPDHAVNIVGWGEMDGVPYWLVRNSWGASVGDKGYWRIERGLPGRGMCGYRGFIMVVNGSIAYH